VFSEVWDCSILDDRNNAIKNVSLFIIIMIFKDESWLVLSYLS